MDGRFRAASVLTGAVTAVGSALITFAVGAGAPLWVTGLFLLAGVGQVVAAVAGFREHPWAVSPASTAAFLTPVGVWMGLVVTGSPEASTVVLLPMLTGVFLAVISAISLHLGFQGRTKPLPAGWFILTLLTASMAVASLVTPALAGTVAGEHAVPHGEHLLLEDLHEPGH